MGPSECEVGDEKKLEVNPWYISKSEEWTVSDFVQWAHAITDPDNPMYWLPAALKNLILTAINEEAKRFIEAHPIDDD